MPRKRKSPANSKVKRGPLSESEKVKIRTWMGSKSNEEMAMLLSRPLLPVEKYVEACQADLPTVSVRRSDADEFRNELHASPEWPWYEDELTQKELMYFENKYIIYRHDLKESTATELQQLHQLITLEIMIRRFAADSKKNNEDKDRLERLINMTDETNSELLVDLHAQLNACRATAGSRTKEYKDLLEKHGALLVHLKSTRDQRIKSLAQQGMIMQLLKELEDESKRKAITEISGLVEIATEKERKRLGSYHKYADGMIDRPLLTTETINYIEDSDEISQ